MSLTSPSWRLSVPPLASLEGRGCRTLGGGSVGDGISHPLLITSSPVPILMPSYSPSSIKRKALQEEVLLLLVKGVIELAPPSPSYYSRLFVVWKTSGSWKPVIDLSRLYSLITQTRFKLETNQSVLHAIRRDDWIVSIDLKDASLQIPVYLDSR